MQVEETCQQLNKRFPSTQLDSFIVMPNHFHWIIHLQEVGAEILPPLHLGKTIAYFQYETTKTFNADRVGPLLKLWQRNYYEHIIRNDEELNCIREYIQNNPLQWDLDRENPQGKTRSPEHTWEA